MDQTVLIVLIAILVLLSFIFTNLALKDIILKDFGSNRTKLIWHFIAIVPLIGWLVYLIFGYKKGRRKPI